MFKELLHSDEQLFIFLNSLGNDSWDSFWLIITDKLTFIPLYAILLFLIYRKLGVKSLLLIVVIVAVMITFTDQITNLFKYILIKRSRPCREDHLQEVIRFIASGCGRYGFFSGHAANSMAAAVFAGLLLKPHYKNLVFILLFWSALVAYSRIYVGVHYPLDIVCGLSFGGFAGFLFYKLYHVIRDKFISV